MIKNCKLKVEGGTSYMKNNKIMIIGCGGSGKSTLAKRLGERLNLPVIHLDQLFWKSGWEHVSDEEFDSLLHSELLKVSWIIDGNFNRTIKDRLEYCDMIIYLDYSRFTCLFGAIKRVLINYGKTRPDMGVNCPERFDLEFLKWIWNFNKNNREKYYKILSKVSGKYVVILHNRKQCRDLFDRLVK